MHFPCPIPFLPPPSLQVNNVYAVAKALKRQADGPTLAFVAAHCESGDPTLLPLVRALPGPPSASGLEG